MKCFNIKKYAYWIIAICSLVLIGISIWWLYQFVPNALTPDFFNSPLNMRQAMANLGDYFGGVLGPIFAFF